MFPLGHKRDRASGLILALGILAMLAIMGTTFVMLMRVNNRLSRVQSDDLMTEMLASGVANYCLSILRDDQDRTIYKYENRDQAAGNIRDFGTDESPMPLLHIPGRNTDYWAPQQYRYGTATSNDVWFHSADASPYVSHTSLYGGRAGSYQENEAPQASFGGEHFQFAIVDRDDTIITDPNEQRQESRYYALLDCPDNGLLYDLTSFLTHGYRCYLQPGGRLTGAYRMPGGVYWRWAAKMGIPEERYMNLNAAGNNEIATQAGRNRLENLDGHGLTAHVVSDETCAPTHLGILSWRGYPGEVNYNTTDDATGLPGFHPRYNAVHYSPYQLDPYRTLATPFKNMTGSKPDGSGGSEQPPPLWDAALAEQVAPEWVKARWGDDGLAADGSDRFRIGWRRDAATYYKIPSPDYPMDDDGGAAANSDHYFGASEALDHQNEDIAIGTSRVFSAVMDKAGSLGGARVAFGKARGYIGTHGCDTILRGKIWPDEGPLPWRPGAAPGDWRHIDILKRVNLNMIGAEGPEGLPGEDAELKQKWRQKRERERARLYYMLKALLTWTNTPKPEHEACQFIASLADMVDRDKNETYFNARTHADDSAAPADTWALGVEKHPVINEAVVFLRNAQTASYDMYRFRVELYNPAENIPWVRDTDEAYDISEYVIRLDPSAGTEHNYKVGTLTRYTTDPNTTHPDGMLLKADGLYGGSDTDTWNRFAHLGWPGDWPSGLTQTELESTIRLSLWKPLSTDDEDGNPAANVVADGTNVVNMLGKKYLCVDRTPPIRFVPVYPEGSGPAPEANHKGKFLSVYRRWDPMNALFFGSPDPPTEPIPAGEEDPRNHCSVIWCPGWAITNFPSLGRPNNLYPKDAFKDVPPVGAATVAEYQRRFETNFKTPDTDLPSIGWLGELFLKNCAQDGPLTWVHSKGQTPIVAPNQSPCSPWGSREDYANLLETAKIDIYRPWGKVHNLNIFDLLTVRDPSNDGIDNDGDGAIDDEDTGYQDGDQLGPEVRVYGMVDMNHACRRVVAAFWPGIHVPYMYYVQCHGLNLERGKGTWVAQGPRDTIGDMNRLDLLHTWPGSWMGEFGWHVGVHNYAASMNLGSASLDHWGYGKWRWYDDDGDGILDDRDERDFFFTQAANFMTTRSSTFTIEVAAQLCETPYYPGSYILRPAYNTRRVFTDKHLILLVDRSTTLRIDENGQCDFTGPVRILARRWAHQRR